MIYHTTNNGSSPIIPGLSNIQGINTPLVSFDTIVDTDFGIMLLIDREFLDLRYFNAEWFNQHHVVKNMVQALASREMVNPLYLAKVTSEPPIENDGFDTLYFEFLNHEEYYKKVLDLSIMTAIGDFILLADASNGEVKPSIVCRSPLEVSFLKENLKTKCPIFLLSELDDASIYQQYIFKYSDDIYTKTLEPKIGFKKSIYLASYKFNQLESLPDDSFVKRTGRNFNRLSYIDLYNMQELFDGRRIE